MAPRGFLPSQLRRTRISFSRCWRYYTTETSHPSNKVQIYLSQSRDPFLNLSIEHHLLQKSHPDSTVLFLYTNRPCVVIGRNQNPWLEVNLGQLKQGLTPLSFSYSSSSPSPLRQQLLNREDDEGRQQQKQANEPIALVRRRSGGGTVFHDTGNVNYSVICPTTAFDRDRHAQMVVRALSALGVAGARVNERHDIVQDVIAAAAGDSNQQQQTFKISGSAYKLTRLRGLHHGTCLLSSAHLASVPGLLRSPAAPFLRARGVESVRAPIRNVDAGAAAGVLGTGAFEDAVVAEFRRMYGAADVRVQVVGAADSVEEEDAVRQGRAELASPEWVFGQTPQFAFSTHPTAQDPRERPPLPGGLSQRVRLAMVVRQSQIQDMEIEGLDGQQGKGVDAEGLARSLREQHLHHIGNWKDALGPAALPKSTVESLGTWLNEMFGLGPSAESQNSARADSMTS